MKYRQRWRRQATAGARRRLGHVMMCVLGLTVIAAGLAPVSQASAQPASGQAAAKAVTVGAGTRLTARFATRPPVYSKAQLGQLKEQLRETEIVHLGHRGPTPVGPALSDQARQPNPLQSSATTIRDSPIPAAAIAGGSTYASSTQEPSTDANGVNVFQTGNWYASRSTNNGSTWTFLNPFTLFGSGFCCDQVTAYDAAHGREFWLLQFNNHLVIANASASGSNPYSSWCYWNITPGWIGQPSTTGLDYNDITIGNNYLYIATNFFPSSGGSGSAVLRLPTAQMSTCSGFGFNYLTRTDNFTFKLVPGSTDTLYFGSNWGQTNGSSFRLFAWPESSGSYSWWNRTVASYGFFTRNSGQNCASKDGVVNNWCQYADSRVLGAYRAGGVIGFSFNAKQDAAHPFPYSRLVYFRESDKAYLGSGDLWGSWGAIQFLSLAPNSVGRIGGTFAWGGGTGTTHYYPGAATYTTAPTSVATDPNYYLWGTGNTCAYGGLYRWGDYLTVRKLQSDPTKWIAAGYAIKGADCGKTDASGNPLWYAEPHNVVFFG